MPSTTVITNMTIVGAMKAFNPKAGLNITSSGGTIDIIYRYSTSPKPNPKILIVQSSLILSETLILVRL